MSSFVCGIDFFWPCHDSRSIRYSKPLFQSHFLGRCSRASYPYHGEMMDVTSDGRRAVNGSLTRDRKFELVRALDARGVFLARGSVRQVGDRHTYDLQVHPAGPAAVSEAVRN